MLGRLVKTHGARFGVTLIIILALFSHSTATVRSQEPVELDISYDINIPWNISDVYPGSSGNATFNLFNISNTDGFVYIWISDIQNFEGANPESETGDTDQPGELINFLYFNVDATEISTNVGLPETLTYFPQSAEENRYMYMPLNAHANTTLVWEWEFAKTGQSHNDAQGDSLLFNINYTLVDELYVQDSQDSTWNPPIPPDKETSDETNADEPVDSSEEQTSKEDQTDTDEPVDSSEERISEPASTTPEPDIAPGEIAVIEPLPQTVDDTHVPEPDDPELQPIAPTDTSVDGLPIQVILAVTIAFVIVMLILAYIRRSRLRR